MRSLFPITDGYKPEGKGWQDGGRASLSPSLTRAHVGREEEIMFIVLLVYQSPPPSLSFPVLILAGGGSGVGFVNLNSPLSLEGGNT